jgi:glycosyltransferase involved in cell wall biosynthesis
MANFNHGKFIPRALRAFLTQSLAAKEIIVIDDGSTDDSVRIIEAFARRYPSIRLICNPVNRGIVESIHSGLEAATGEFVLFAAADDFVLPGLFSRALAALTEYPEAAFFCSGVALVDNANRVIGLRPVTQPSRRRSYLSPADVRCEIAKTDFWFIGTSAVFRRRFVVETGYLDARLGSIGDVISSRALAFRHGFYFDPEVLAAYNKDPASFSGRSALSVANSRKLLAAADAWIAENLPEDVRGEQRRLFVRRMAFGFARLWVVWRSGTIDTDAIAEILDFGPIDRKILAALGRIPLASAVLTLGWMTLRQRPFGILALAEAWRRALYFHWSGKAKVQREVDKIADCPSCGTPSAAVSSG